MARMERKPRGVSSHLYVHHRPAPLSIINSKHKLIKKPSDTNKIIKSILASSVKQERQPEFQLFFHILSFLNFI